MTSTTHASVAGPLTLLQAAELTQWYDEFAPTLRRAITSTALRTANGLIDADDVIQETFIRLMRHVAHVSSLSDAHRKNYVFQAAGCVAVDLRRRQAGRVGSEARAQFADAVPLSAVANSAMQPVTASHAWRAGMQPEQTTAARMTLRAVWEATPPQHREMVAMLAAGYDTTEIARRLGIKQRAVILRCARLRQTLREVAGKIA